MNKCSVRLWAALLLIPVPLLILAFFAQVFALFSSPEPSAFVAIISALSLLFGFPVWLVILVRAISYNGRFRPHEQAQSPASQQQQLAPLSSFTPAGQPPY